MLTIHFANRYETLSGLLAERLAAGKRSVFVPDEVIVPSAALRRQLTLELARRHGICTNVQFGYLARWLWQLIARVVPGVQAESPFAPDVLTWRIVAAFDEPAWPAAHARLAGYLARADAVMRYELAQKVAGLFDQYITFRPEWLAAWSLGQRAAIGSDDDAARADEAWQSALWRHVDAGLGAEHPSTPFTEALRSNGAALVTAGTLPAVAHVFCLPTMPTMHLALLQALGQCSEVHLYALNPCREYWFEVVDRRHLAYLAARGRVDYQEEGQRLLAAWGKQVQSQLGLLVEVCGEAGVDDARFDDDESAGTTLLIRLQRSILDLEDLVPGSIVLADSDRSVEVHVCHSLARELEVLQDRLLALFADEAGAPAPSDILVVTPDLDAAAPLIDAIFGTAPADRRIPFNITGRARSRVNAAARALLELLALAGSRFTASAVFGLLQQPPVARRFGLSTDALDRVHGWLRDAGVHWALDAEHRSAFGLPAQARHSFADGLERLFLGYALPAPADAPFDGRLPAGDAEGSDALALGALWCFIDALATLRREVAAPRPAQDWPPLLVGLLERFVGPPDEELEDFREVLAAVEALGAQWRRSAIGARPLPLDVVRAALAQALDDPARGGIPTGAVTFSSMTSLRNLPYRVICAIGLNDGAFPTSARPVEFDLMALKPRRGDRQRRIDERNLFLDLLLAARGNFYLSYVGRSARDNAVLPPSVLVSELLEYLVPAVAAAPATAHARLVVEHPLQAFSEDAFRRDGGDPRLRSFHREYAEALQHRLAAPATALAGTALADVLADALDSAEGDAGVEDDDDRGIEPAQPFFRTPLATPGDEWRTVSLAQLLQFFRNPCRYLLRQRLQLDLPRDAAELDDDEPFVADVPGRSALAARLLPLLMNGAGLGDVRALAEAGTELPAGAFGRGLLEHELASLQAFAAQWRALAAEPVRDPHAVALELPARDGPPWRLSAAFTDLRTSGLLRCRYDELRARYYLDAWLHHLLLCAGPPPGVAPRTTWLGLGQRFSLKPCADAPGVLAQLLGLYEHGLREPLYFFPKTAWKYLEKNESASAAAGAWHSFRDPAFGEDADAAYRLALRGLPEPMGAGFPEFQACARAVFGPLRAHLEVPA